MTGLFVAESLYRPAFAPAGVAIAAGLVVAVLILSARRERAWWTLIPRLVALAGLVWLLMGPSHTEPGNPSSLGRPTLAILIDQSGSMAQRDGGIDNSGQAMSRFDALSRTWLSTERINQIRQIADVQVIGFDQQIQPRSNPLATPAGTATHLYEALQKTDADATLLLTDGHDTTRRGSAAWTDTDKPGRVFAVPVGATRSAPDASLQAWADSDRLFEDQPTTITASIRHTRMQGRRAVVELIHNGEPIERRPITLDQTEQLITFDISPALAPGKTVEAHHYSARLELLGTDEAYPENNAEDVFVQVTRGRVRVLLIEGEPYWDTRSLARLLGAHPRFDLTAVYGFGDERRSLLLGEESQAQSDPATDLDAFDVVVLGRRVERLVDEGFAGRLDGFVRSGGAVVFARGEPFGRGAAEGRALLEGVSAISPVSWGEPIVRGMRVRLGDADDGDRGPLADLDDSAVLSRMPGMLAATRIEGRKSASLVLLEQQDVDGGQPMAALATLRVGSGVSMAVLTEGLWRWELLPGIDDNDPAVDSVYGLFWVRAMQWLVSGGAFLPGQDIALEADRLGVEPGEPVNLRISTRYVEQAGLDLRLEVTGPGPDARPQAVTLEPGQSPDTYNAAFTPTEPGVYNFALTAPGRSDLIAPDQPLTTRIAVVDRSPELRDTSAKPELLKRLTESTGGQCLELDEVEPLIDYLQTLQRARGIDDIVDYDFNTWPVFLWLAGCFGLEWLIRRRSGLR